MNADQSRICFEEGSDPRVLRVHPRLISPSLSIAIWYKVREGKDSAT